MKIVKWVACAWKITFFPYVYIEMKCISIGVMIFAVLALALVGSVLPFGGIVVSLLQVAAFLWWLVGCFAQCETISFANLHTVFN
jgi:hypothetical protein